MPIYFYAFIFFISLFLGSFYNVVGLRTLSGEKISLPPSHCTSCNHRLSPLDLVPLFSWLFLRGKCRYCKEKISPIYPFGELLTAISYTLIIYTYGYSWESLVHIIFITLMIIATVTDLKETMVPDRFFIIGLALIFPIRMLTGTPIIPYLIGGGGAFLLMLAILLLSGGKLGGADVKLYALIGSALGFLPAIETLFYASMIGLLFNIPFIIMKKKDKAAEIPFVPFITLGILVVYIFESIGFQPL